MLGPIGAELSPKNAADFDGDGLVDILFISASNGLFLARGTGGGAFSEAKNIPVPTGNLTDARAADVDGDHRLDLVLSFDEPPSLHVLTGKGDGTFAEARAYAVAAPLALVGASDLDADGRDEILATANGAVPNLQVLSHLTDPEFQTQPVDVPSSNIASVQVAQIVRGGPSALVAWTEGTGVAVANVLVPKSTGGYGAAIVMDDALAVADVDNDGLADVIAVGGVAGQGNAADEPLLSVALSVGDGTFRKPKATNVPAGSHFIAAADVDGDHDVDLVTLYSGKFLAVFKGHGDGTFESPVPFTTDASWTDSNDMLVADLDNDGRTDIAVPSASVGLVVMSGGCTGK